MYARNKKKKKKKKIKKIRNQPRTFFVRVRVLFRAESEAVSNEGGAPASSTRRVRRARTYAGAAARFVRFAGLSYFDTYKLQPKRFDALKRDFSRKIWKCGFLFVSLQPETIKL